MPIANKGVIGLSPSKISKVILDPKVTYNIDGSSIKINQPTKVSPSPASLSIDRIDLAATTVGNYALFAGGFDSIGSTVVDVVDVYDNKLIKSTSTVLSTARRDLTATTVGEYALFAGGRGGGTSDVIDPYNTSLTRGNPVILARPRDVMSATSIGKYALFGGGTVDNTKSVIEESNLVEAFSNNLVRVTPVVLFEARTVLAATTTDNESNSYALFGGGFGGDDGYGYSTHSAVVDAYNTSLTRSTPTVLSEARQQLAATSVGEYALFGGGRGYHYSAVIDAYNAALTRSTPTDLSQAKYNLAGTTINNYALFGGGMSSSYDTLAIDTYDISLVHAAPTRLTENKTSVVATTVGDGSTVYGLFGGGYGHNYNTVVDVYTSPKVVFDYTHPYVIPEGVKYIIDGVTHVAPISGVAANTITIQKGSSLTIYRTPVIGIY